MRGEYELLLVAFSEAGVDYARRAQELGARVRVLDCFDTYHRQLRQWYGRDMLLTTDGNRAAVREAAVQEQLDVAVVHDDVDFVRSALVVQSLCQAGVPEVLVVTEHPSHRRMFRSLGAHQVIVSSSREAAWAQLYRYLPKHMPA
ncbi:hypothetical protein [Alicyclobacillus shizuokensis]|uniref:hypothetical protein n=1 Tax=Alicyclobacillus shizuokensis TaxID=392014 RepID=UPI00082EE1CC|nr:hypothetical protein [Alicyclobacillus shizuokensis]MCL6626839.1 hypothetical protein [Alicyclobacillus shizuokensis]